MHKFIENIIGFSLKNHVFILFYDGSSVCGGNCLLPEYSH